jgi:hypothetical protein
VLKLRTLMQAFVASAFQAAIAAAVAEGEEGLEVPWLSPKKPNFIPVGAQCAATCIAGVWLPLLGCRRASSFAGAFSMGLQC